MLTSKTASDSETYNHLSTDRIWGICGECKSLYQRHPFLYPLPSPPSPSSFPEVLAAPRYTDTTYTQLEKGERLVSRLDFIGL